MNIICWISLKLGFGGHRFEKIGNQALPDNQRLIQCTICNLTLKPE